MCRCAHARSKFGNETNSLGTRPACAALALVASSRMNEESYKAALSAIPKTYVEQGRDARKTHEKHIQVLLQQVSSVGSYCTNSVGKAFPGTCIRRHLALPSRVVCWKHLGTPNLDFSIPGTCTIICVRG